MNAKEAYEQTMKNIKDYEDSTLERIYDEIGNKIDEMKFELILNRYISDENVIDKLKKDGYQINYNSSTNKTTISWGAKII